jgi:hypothetical protein
LKIIETVVCFKNRVIDTATNTIARRYIQWYIQWTFNGFYS